MRWHIWGLAVLLIFSVGVSGRESDMDVGLKIDPEKYMEYMDNEHQISAIHGQVEAGAKSINALWGDLWEAHAQGREEQVKRKVQDLAGQLRRGLEYLRAEDRKLEESRVMAMAMLQSDARRYEPVPLVLLPEEKKAAAGIFDQLSEKNREMFGSGLGNMIKARESAQRWNELLRQHQSASFRLDTAPGINRAIVLIVIRRNKTHAMIREYEAQEDLMRDVVDFYTRREVFGGSWHSDSEEAIENASKFMEGLKQESTFEGNPFN